MRLRQSQVAGANPFAWGLCEQRSTMSSGQSMEGWMAWAEMTLVGGSPWTAQMCRRRCRVRFNNVKMHALYLLCVACLGGREKVYAGRGSPRTAEAEAEAEACR